MLTTKMCKECGSDIVFSYIDPSKSFRIKDGKIVRNDAWTGPGYDDPYLEFYCSNDKEHDEVKNLQDMIDWSVEVEKEFYEKIFPTL